jgi:hypothetical protein
MVEKGLIGADCSTGLALVQPGGSTRRGPPLLTSGGPLPQAHRHLLEGPSMSPAIEQPHRALANSAPP